jgi:uncharacterized Zn finger protein
MADMSTIPDFTEAGLRRLAGARTFDRGRAYLGQVEDLDVSATAITATVRGTHDYLVSLCPGDQELRGSCSCPQGQEGLFCKHCVAVGLVVLAEADAGLPRLVEATKARKGTVDRWLESLTKADLLAEVRGLAAGDPALRRRLEVRAASVAADAVATRQAVRELVTLHRDLGFDEAVGYAAQVREAAAAIGALTDAGQGAAATGIAREAIGLLSQAFARVDPSVGAVGSAAGELLAAHLRACEAAPPDPASLGDYLADLLLHDDEAIEPDLHDYAGLLGEAGFDRLHDKISRAYARDPRNGRAGALMEIVLEAEGDVDALVAFYAAHLDDRGRNHLRIARELDRAGRGDEALGWAEEGLREAAEPDSSLVGYLAGRYAEAGRAGDVLDLRRDRFRAGRTLENYQALRRAATDAGAWPAERPAAIELLTADAARARGQVAWAGAPGPVLIDALLDDGDAEAAWAAAPRVATPEQRLRLADAIAGTRPADALPVYLDAIGRLTKMTGNDVYQRIARLLLAARACHRALGTEAEFNRYAADLRAGQKSKRNLIKILDQHNI